MGKQSSLDSVWVLSPNVHIDENGILLQVSPFAWQPIGGPQIELSSNRNQPLSFELKSDIALPLQSAVPLNKLLTLLQKTLKHNLLPGIK